LLPLPDAATFVFFLALFFLLLLAEAAAAAAAECELKQPNSDFHDDLAIVALVLPRAVCVCVRELATGFFGRIGIYIHARGHRWCAGAGVDGSWCG
jgi:hypothetical protein